MLCKYLRCIPQKTISSRRPPAPTRLHERWSPLSPLEPVHRPRGVPGDQAVAQLRGDDLAGPLAGLAVPTAASRPLPEDRTAGDRDDVLGARDERAPVGRGQLEAIGASRPAAEQPERARLVLDAVAERYAGDVVRLAYELRPHAEGSRPATGAGRVRKIFVAEEPVGR